MSQDRIPAALSSFILGNLHSVEQLEILLLLSRSPDETFSVDQIDRHIRASAQSVTKRLTDLVSRDLIDRRLDSDIDVYQAKKDPQVLKICQELACYYATHHSVIIELIYSRPANAMGSFSNAFRFKN